MRTPRLVRLTREERKDWYAGAHYCQWCSDTQLTWSGTVYFDTGKQGWCEANAEVDNCYCGRCQDATRAQWYPFIQINLWDDEELFDVDN
jgi:hypothetical protein